ncbi:Abi family protein [Pediococcus pentosaceus]|uniref:Abi family protein n=1 Tax=Pediococcus pentosaceus TaxID=1255 RepID=UPI003F289E4C
MGIKPSKSRQNLIDNLDCRLLNIPDNKKALQLLTNLNYFQVVNGLENIFLTTVHPKKFNKVSIFDFERLYYDSKKIATEISRVLDDFEERLKSSISYHFSQSYCMNINDTMQYTNKNNYRDDAEFDGYPLNSEQYAKIIQTFKATESRNKFLFFQPWFLTNLVQKNDHINQSFYRDIQYTAPNNVMTYQYDSQVAVPLWVAIETLPFGSLIYLCHYLKDDEMSNVLNDFGLTANDRIIFLNVLDVLKELRNHIAHGNLLLRFQTPAYIKFTNDFVNRFELNPKSRGTTGANRRVSYASKIYLYDSLKILHHFDSTKTVVKQFKKMFYHNMKNMKQGEIYNKRILKAIDAPSYRALKNLT